MTRYSAFVPNTIRIKSPGLFYSSGSRNKTYIVGFITIFLFVIFNVRVVFEEKTEVVYEVAHIRQYSKGSSELPEYKLADKKSFPSRIPLTNNNSKISFHDYYSTLEFLRKADEGCERPLGLLIIVKSASANFEERAMIRSTWGNTGYLKNTSFSEDLQTKLVFIVGQPSNESRRQEINQKLESEYRNHSDIVCVDFLDTYDNNTVKTMAALRWTLEMCADFRYVFLVDDDVYISVENVVQYLSHPIAYELNVFSLQNNLNNFSRGKLNWNSNRMGLSRSGKNLMEFDLHTGKVYFGHAMRGTKPVRVQQGLEKKWYVSEAEYPDKTYPDYISGMAVVLSKPTVVDFISASRHTAHLHIDDAYLGLLAHKQNIKAVHSDYFRVNGYDVLVRNNWIFKYLLAVHGFEIGDLVALWNMYGVRNYIEDG